MLEFEFPSVSGAGRERPELLLSLLGPEPDEAGNSRRQLLGRMNRELAACTGRQDIFRCLGRLALPALGDWCDLDVLQDEVLRRAAAFRAPHGEVHGPPGGPPSLLARRVSRSGHPELLQGPSEQEAVLLSSGDGDLPRFQAAGLLDCMAVPLRSAQGCSSGCSPSPRGSRSRTWTRRRWRSPVALPLRVEDRGAAPRARACHLRGRAPGAGCRRARGQSSGRWGAPGRCPRAWC